MARALRLFGTVELVFTQDKALARNVKIYRQKLKEIGLQFGIEEEPGVSQSCNHVAQKIEKDKKLKKKID